MMPGHNRITEFKAAGSMTARAGDLQHSRAQTSVAQEAMAGRTGMLLQEEALVLTGAPLAGKCAMAAGAHCWGGCM